MFFAVRFQAITFCQTRKTASWLASKLVKDGHAVGMLSGELGIEERIMVRITKAWGMTFCDFSRNLPYSVWQRKNWAFSF